MNNSKFKIWIYITSVSFLFSMIAFSQENKIEQIPIIEINEKLESVTLQLSDICSNITYTKLEFDEKHPITGSSSIHKIHVTDDYIFLLNKGIILRYTRDGKTVVNVSQIGQGPRDYLMGSSFVIDEKNKTMFIKNAKNILVFDYDKNLYLRTFELPFDYACKIIRADNGMIIMSGTLNNRHRPTQCYFSFILLNAEGKNLFEKTNPEFLKPKSEHRWGAVLSEGIDFWRAENNTFCSIMESGSDTIFSITKDITFSPRYIIQCPIKCYNENSASILGETNKYIFWSVTYCTTKYTFKGIYDKELNKSFITKTKYKLIDWFDRKIMDLDTKKMADDLGFINDLDGGRPIVLPIYNSQSSTQWHYFIDAIELIEHVNSPTFKNAVAKDPKKKEELERFVKTLDEDDNPVLVTLTLK